MRPLSIFHQVIALALVMLAITVGIAVLLLFILPLPGPARVSVDEMSWALDRKPSKVIDTHVAEHPPVGMRTKLVENAIARQLSRPADEFRAVWLREPDGGVGPGQSVLLIDRREAVVDVTGAGFKLHSGPKAELRNDTLLPLVISARQLSDGRWLWAVPQDPELAAWRVRIVLGLALASLLLAILAWAIARRIAAPIEMLGKVAAGADLRVLPPLPTDGPREVREVAVAFGSMHRRMAAAASEQLRTLAAVAHDLRTPMTALRVRAERIGEPLRGRMVSDLERMSDMVAETLDLAEAATVIPRLATVDVAALIRAKHQVAQEIGHSFTLEHIEAVEVVTDGAMLSRMLDNLIENALRYGTAARVRLEHHARGARVTIDSDGPTIPHEKLADLINPFVRLDTSRSRSHGGAGLGLTIVSRFAALLNVEFRLENQRRGVRAVVTF